MPQRVIKQGLFDADNADKINEIRVIRVYLRL